MERIPYYIKACFIGYVITGAPVILVISIKIKPIKILKKWKRDAIVRLVVAGALPQAPLSFAKIIDSSQEGRSENTEASS